jgi:AraC-like DNA-binding protein
MDLTIRKLTGELLRLYPAVATVTRIPGGSAWSCDDEEGRVFIEEFRSGSFTIRFGAFRFFKKMNLYLQEHSPLVRARIATRNSWVMAAGNDTALRIRKGQFVIYKPAIAEQLVFEKNEEYECIDAIFATEKLIDFEALFPGLQDLLDGLGASLDKIRPARIRRITPDVLDILHNIEHCAFEGSLRNYYLEHKMEELMFLLLTILLKEQPVEAPAKPWEIEAVHAAEQLIMQDIMQHIPIRVLAKKVGLNELRLKYVFKQEFGEAIFEHLLNARMREAVHLLKTTDKPVKEIAALTGYRYASSFLNAFRNRFDYTPGSLRRRP